MTNCSVNLCPRRGNVKTFYNRTITRSLIVFLATAATAISLDAVTSDAAARARTIAKDAYMTIYRHPFEGEILAAAAKRLNEAHAMNEKEPYTYLGAAQLVMEGGYHSGRVLDAQLQSGSH